VTDDATHEIARRQAASDRRSQHAPQGLVAEDEPAASGGSCPVHAMQNLPVRTADSERAGTDEDVTVARLRLRPVLQAR
jgi:hypothetical protein